MTDPATPVPKPAPPPGVSAAPSTTSAKPWGRVDADGSVYVRLPEGPDDSAGPDGPDSEVKVGEWLAGDPADGIRVLRTQVRDAGGRDRPAGAPARRGESAHR